MRIVIVAGIATVLTVLGSVGTAFAAANPSGHGLPSQSCQDIEAAGGTVPGNSSSSPGSPFNEPLDLGRYSIGLDDAFEVESQNAVELTQDLDLSVSG